MHGARAEEIANESANDCFSVLFCGFVIAGKCFAQRLVKPIKTTVCEISVNPTRSAGKTVVFVSRFESDGMERSVLTDSTCMDVGLSVSTPEHFKGEDELKKALSVGRPGTLDKTITGTFTGRFLWRPRKNPKRVLTLTEVRDLSSAMK
jgi:hypothetical protein